MRAPRWLAAGLPILALALIRGLGLAEYPPPDVDEGFWSIGAKNQVVFHDAFMDHRLHSLLSPTTFVLLCAEFSAIGPSLLAARWFSVVCGLASVGVFWDLARRSAPVRPWLPALLFGLNSSVVLVNRRMFLETHQLLWILLAANFWLRPGRKSPIVAAACFALALLTKINSIYVLPAFLWSAPVEEGRSSGRIGFLGVLGVVTMAGYLVDYSASPSGFRSAFAFELDGRNFLDDGVAFHLGRFGLHPDRLRGAAIALAKGFPLTIPLALVGIRRFGGGSRADRFFAAWLAVGLPFTLGQIYIPERYLLTLAPPLVHFAGRTLNDLLDRGGRTIASILLVLALLYHSGRIGRGIERIGADPSYTRAVAYVKRHVPRDDPVLAAPYIGVDLPQRSFDFFRMLHPDDGGPPPRMADVVRRHQIHALIVDREWRFYMTPEVARFIGERCVHVARFGSIDVYRIAPVEAGR